MFIEGAKELYINKDCLETIISYFDRSDPFTLLNFSRTCWSTKQLCDQLYTKFRRISLNLRVNVDFNRNRFCYIAGTEAALLPLYFHLEGEEVLLRERTRRIISKSPYIHELLKKMRYATIDEASVHFCGDKFNDYTARFIVRQLKKVTENLFSVDWFQSSPYPYCKFSVHDLKPDEYFEFFRKFALANQTMQDFDLMLQNHCELVDFIYEKKGVIVYVNGLYNTCINIVKLIRHFLKKLRSAEPIKRGTFAISFRVLDESNFKPIYSRLGIDELEEGLIRYCDVTDAYGSLRFTLPNGIELQIRQERDEKDYFVIHFSND